MSSIDIIIPIKGRPELLHDRSLRSLLAQTLQTFKVTIVDDGSTQGEVEQIEEIAEEYRQKGLTIDVIQNGRSSGAAGARNFGFESTSAEYVLWFDSDDILLEEKLEISFNLIKSGKFDLVITRAQHIADSKLINEFWGEPVAPNRSSYEFHFPYQTMCALYRRSFLQTREIKWHEDLEMMNDWLFSNEVILKTNNWIFSPKVTSHYFVPAAQSNSIGSRLSKSKVYSQKRAIFKLHQMLKSQNKRFSTTGRLKLLKHRFRLAMSSIRLAFDFETNS